nr:hypothetical protein [Stenotrophomonas maltophilia]
MSPTKTRSGDCTCTFIEGAIVHQRCVRLARCGAGLGKRDKQVVRAGAAGHSEQQ